jgi:hypothetical protein
LKMNEIVDIGMFGSYEVEDNGEMNEIEEE